MHVLTVIDHPDPASFTHAIAARFTEGVVSAGHSFEVADLHRDGFDPLWSIADGGDTAPEDVLREQARIENADAICLVFPLFWWGMPAMMKGWVDRVFSWGWAYDQLDDPNLSLLRPRSGLLLVPAGARSDEMEARGYTSALHTQWMEGTFGYFGLSPRRIELLCGSKGSDARRAGLLQRAYDAGRRLDAPAGSDIPGGGL